MKAIKKGEWNDYWLNFPAEVTADKRLLGSERLLLMFITALDNDSGCWAHNQFLADLVGCSAAKVSKSIQKLQSLGYIVSNEKSEKDGGRYYVRRVKESLKSYKRDKSTEEVSHPESTKLPSKKTALIYKGKKEEYSEKEYSIEDEKKVVIKMLKIPFGDKWMIYSDCKAKYSENYGIFWDKESTNDLIELCNRLIQFCDGHFGELSVRKKAAYFILYFETLMHFKPNYFKDSLPSTFIRFWNSAIQNPKFVSAFERIEERYKKRDDSSF